MPLFGPCPALVLGTGPLLLLGQARLGRCVRLQTNDLTWRLIVCENVDLHLVDFKKVIQADMLGHLGP